MYVPEHFPRHRPSQTQARNTTTHEPPLTLEWLVARDIEAYTARRRVRAPATMDAQASTRPSPASLRKNGTRVVGQA